MAKRRVLSGAYRRRRMGGAPEQGRNRPAPGPARKAANSSGSHKGRSGGIAPAPSHAPQAPQSAELPETEPAPGKAVAAAVSDLPKTVERTSDLKSECPGCGDAGVRMLFRGTDRLYH